MYNIKRSAVRFQIFALTARRKCPRWEGNYQGETVLGNIFGGMSRRTSYLSDAVQTVSSYSLRSSIIYHYGLRRATNTLEVLFGERAFAYAGPCAWNRLPEHIRHQSTPAPL